jgi:DNA replication and repair protein RecF
MWLKELTITNCRIISRQKLALSPHINLIYGENASGKTSILEALSILSFGRSFRSSRVAEVIRHNEESLISNALLQRNDNEEASMRIGVQKTRLATHIRINRQTIKSQASLSKKLPLTIIHPTSYELITGGASLRRKYIDWIAFYCEPDFHRLWLTYNAVLKQRNAALKSSKLHYAVEHLTEQLCGLQPAIYHARVSVLIQLQQTLKEHTPDFLTAVMPELKITSGYPVDVPLNKDALYTFHQTKMDKEKYKGRTLFGAHLANLDISLNGHRLAIIASRGQIKLVTLMLLIARNLTLTQSGRQAGIIAIDDLDSELDTTHQDQLIDFLTSLKQQLFITTTNPKIITQFEGLDCTLFHVKQGKIV